MVMPKDQIQSELNESWSVYLKALENSIEKLDKDIREASEMAGICTDEWCESTEHVIDELGNMLFAISEPRWSDPDDSRRLKALKKRVYDLYANYKDAYRRSNA